MIREIVGGSLVALALFLAGFSAGRLAGPAELELEVKAELAKDAELESLRAQVSRLEWELKQATEELPEWSEWQ